MDDVGRFNITASAPIAEARDAQRAVYHFVPMHGFSNVAIFSNSRCALKLLDGYEKEFLFLLELGNLLEP